MPHAFNTVVSVRVMDMQLAEGAVAIIYYAAPLDFAVPLAADSRTGRPGLRRSDRRTALSARRYRDDRAVGRRRTGRGRPGGSHRPNRNRATHFPGLLDHPRRGPVLRCRPTR